MELALSKAADAKAAVERAQGLSLAAEQAVAQVLAEA